MTRQRLAVLGSTGSIGTSGPIACAEAGLLLTSTSSITPGPSCCRMTRTWSAAEKPSVSPGWVATLQT